jgi:hypothetical protein
MNIDINEGDSVTFNMSNKEFSGTVKKVIPPNIGGYIIIYPDEDSVDFFRKHDLMADDPTTDDPTKDDPRIVSVNTDRDTIKIKTNERTIQYDIFKTIYPDSTPSYIIMHKDIANNKTYFTQVSSERVQPSSESVQPNIDGGSRKTKRGRRKSRRRRNKKSTRRRRRHRKH